MTPSSMLVQAARVTPPRHAAGARPSSKGCCLLHPGRKRRRTWKRDNDVAAEHVDPVPAEDVVRPEHVQVGENWQLDKVVGTARLAAVGEKKEKKNGIAPHVRHGSRLSIGTQKGDPNLP